MQHNEYPWRDADTLQRLYIDEELSMADVADRLDTSASTIRKWLDKHGISTRTVAEGNSNGDINKVRDEEFLRQEYIEEKKSIRDIATELNISDSIVSKWLNRHEIETRKDYQEQSDAKSELLQDKEWLREKYHVEGKTLKEVSEIANCADDTVKYWIEKHGMQTDSKSESFTDGDVEKLEDEDWLRDQYHEKGLSQKEIAEKLGLEQTTVSQYMIKFDVEIKTHGWHLTDGEIEKLQDADFLREQYWDKGKSSPTIADEIGVAQASVIEALHRYDIETRHGTPTGEDHWNSKPDQPANGKYYGPNWIEQRIKRRITDQARCQRCGMTDAEHNREYNQDIHVHHITNRREFIDEDGILDYKAANDLGNLVTLCFACHRKVETLPLEIDVR